MATAGKLSQFNMAQPLACNSAPEDAEEVIIKVNTQLSAKPCTLFFS